MALRDVLAKMNRDELRRSVNDIRKIMQIYDATGLFALHVGPADSGKRVLTVYFQIPLYVGDYPAG